ncbi:spt2 chromatin [Apiospora hydei]|uniref:Spt2 chromatin n=1 Tax=Apiospora hydei TaxID=1337664 RepID=A0ABR1X118_9PEZI
MPISDLLAEITGEKATANSTPSSIRTSTTLGLKRKADDDASSSAAIKTARTQQNGGPPRSSISRKPSPASGRAPNPTPKSSTSQPGQRSVSAAPATSKPYAGTATANRQAGGPPPARKDLAERPKLPSSTVGSSKIAPARPSPTTSTASEPSKAPKKGSFAEIMARGAKAQQVMPKAGIIQHKALQKPLPKKERETAKGGKRSGANGTTTKGSGQGGASQVKSPRALPKSGAVGDAKSGSKSRPTSSGSDAPEKKKKGPVMTGYAGTARSAPPMKKSTSSGKGAASRRPPGGGLLAPPKVARHDRYDDEYDEELDDFVVDDEDEDDPYARQYGYASDGSSDMEAGMDDIYDEESRAERAARLEDRREEQLLEELKRKKEEKKKRSGYR